MRSLRAGQVLNAEGVRIRVLHPIAPEWERQKVRNDDSVVLELVYRDVAVLLTGDIGADVERELLPLLTRSRVRILKVGHHGSLTSSSTALLEGWRPQIALVSAGRGNTFGHPTPAVLQRLASIGAAVYRTDLDGQITMSTDGRSVTVDTYLSVLDQHDGVDNFRRVGP
jgi:competence protein ComEC